jgi:hypothetical protein
MQLNEISAASGISKDFRGRLSVPVITYKHIWVFAQATALQGAFGLS